MKKLVSLLLCAAMLLTLMPTLAVGAAADSLLDNAVEVWGFNGMTPGQITTNNWTWDYAGFFEGNGDTFMKAEITADGGVNNTQALKLTMLQETVDADARFLCFLADGDSNNKSNWAGAEQLMFYVDASSFGTTETAYLRLRVTDEKDNVYAPANGKTFFRLADGTSEWVSDSVDMNAVSFPAGFKGWVRVPLTDNSWGPAYGGSTKEGQTTPDFDSRKVNLLWMQLTGKTSNADFVGTSLLIDSFMVTSEGSGLPSFSFAGAFGDDMVLQADAPVSVYGTGKAGQTLNVKIIRDKDAVVVCRGDVTVDADGSWNFLSETTVSGGYDTYTVTVSKDDKSLSLNGVLFGEVWVAGGQSNMEWLLSKDMDWEETKAAERNANVRVMQVSGWSPSSEYTDPNGTWKIADSWDNIADCSAVGYYFAEELQEELDVPVGLISTAAGGTPLASWLSKDILEKYPEFETLLTNRGYVNDNSWGSRYSQYNARIAPFKGMQVSGIIWYQGCNESGAYDDDLLEMGLPILYECWNDVFNNTDEPLAFYSVQLTPYPNADLRRSQTDVAMNKGVLAINELTGKALSVPTYDISLDWEANGTEGTNFDPIHPRTKKPVAARLAAAALGNYYGKSEIYSGPVAESFTYNDDGTVEVKFSNVGTGLKAASGTEIIGFQLAKENGSLISATATVTAADTLLITPSEAFGEKAVKVAYAYGNTMRTGNLVNSAGYLALTFYDTTLEETPIKPIDPVEFERKGVLDFDDLSGDLFADGKVSTTYGSTDVGAEAVEEAGYEGSTALAYHYNHRDASTYWSNSIVLNLDNISGADTNWSGAGMLWFWVDTTELGEGVCLDLWLNDVKPALGTAVYSYDGKSIRQISTMFDPWDGSGRLRLPSDYTGFIGVPLSAYENLNLTHISNIYFYMESSLINADNAVSLYLDEFWVTATNEAPDVIANPIVKDPFSLKVWDVDAKAEDFDNSSIHTHYNDALSAGNADAVIEEGKGYDGTAAFGYVFDGVWTQDKGDNNLNFTNMSGIDFVTDWSGADYLWFWIDNTDYEGATSLRIYLNWTKPSVDTPFYTWDGEGEMVQAGTMVDAWGSAGFGKISLPLNYTGFIAIPLASFSGLDISNISQLLLHIDAESVDTDKLPKTIWFDEFWVTAEGSYPLVGTTECAHENTELRNVSAADCTTAGYTGDTYCTDCGEMIAEGTVIEALGHNFVDGKCTRCEAEDPDYEAKDPCEGYTDIDRNSWYHTAADFVIKNGYMGSTKTNALTFEPTTKVSRAMVASIMYRIAGSPDVEYKGSFTDVADGKWFTKAIEWAAQNGLASGKGDGKFDPNGNVTRQELAIFMYKLAEHLGQDVSGRADLSKFSDEAKVPSWAKTYVQWAVSAGLISGKGTGDSVKLAPVDNATRAEFASIIMRFLSKTV